MPGLCFGDWNLTWTGEDGFVDDGVEPDEGHNGGTYQFRVRFNAGDSQSLPYWVKLFIDLDGDGRFSEEETFVAEQDQSDRSIWFVKRVIRVNTKNRPHLAYYFQAFADNKIKSSELCFGPRIGGFNHSFVIEGKGWFLNEALLPMEIRTMEGRDRIIFINTSNSPQKLCLSIPQDSPGPFFPHEDKDTREPNAYVMSVVTTDMDVESVDQKDFNTEGSEDVVGFVPKKAEGPVFGIKNKNAAERIMPGESVAVWMQLRAPAQAKGGLTGEDQWVYIKIEVLQTE